MTESIKQIADAFDASNGGTTKISIASTAQLARQIDAGAPADIFISADHLWMDWLENKKHILANSRTAIAGNKLVVAVRRETENWVSIEALVTKSRFAMAEPERVPAGRYAKQALTSKGWWKEAQGQAAYGENVRITLRRLALGEVPAAIVYASDLTVEPEVRTAFTFADGDHDPIVYQAAATMTENPAAASFLDFLKAPKARSIFSQAGFLPVK